MSSSSNEVPLYRPKPRRAFDLDSVSGNSSPAHPSSQGTDLPAWVNTSDIGVPTSPIDFGKRSRSILNLTASTLFGIYSPTYNDGTEPPTPFSLSRTNSVVDVSDTLGGNGLPNGLKQTASPNPEKHKRRRKKESSAQLALRLSALLVFGIAYGVVVMHLHNTRTFTPTWWEEIEAYNSRYLLIWGIVGVVLGSLLPWIDQYLAAEEAGDLGADGEAGGGGGDWIQTVRSIGAFVGIAYAIRKLAWQSTLQISLTLSLINPFIWYIVDRTIAGFWLSSLVGLVGTMVLIQVNPDLIQAPRTFETRNSSMATGGAEMQMALGGLISYESIGVGVWICSVLFCSTVCFGNIGRKLVLRERDL